MIDNGIPYALKQAQVQKVLGELKALNMLYFNTYEEENKEYYKMKKMIEKFENKLANNFC